MNLNKLTYAGPAPAPEAMDEDGAESNGKDKTKERILAVRLLSSLRFCRGVFCRLRDFGGACFVERAILEVRVLSREDFGAGGVWAGGWVGARVG